MKYSLLLAILLTGCAMPVDSQYSGAQRACNGKLASYKNTSSGAEFTCQKDDKQED